MNKEAAFYTALIVLFFCAIPFIPNFGKAVLFLILGLEICAIIWLFYFFICWALEIRDDRRKRKNEKTN
jgi:hypothetical protein